MPFFAKSNVIDSRDMDNEFLRLGDHGGRCFGLIRTAG